LIPGSREGINTNNKLENRPASNAINVNPTEAPEIKFIDSLKPYLIAIEVQAIFAGPEVNILIHVKSK
jgi:hypothetical protein